MNESTTSSNLKDFDILIFGLIIQNTFIDSIFNKYQEISKIIPGYIIKSALVYLKKTPSDGLRRFLTNAKFNDEKTPREIVEAFKHKRVVKERNIESLDEYSVLSAGVLFGNPNNLVVLLESEEMIQLEVLMVVDSNGDTVFHNICKNIDTHSSLVFQKILEISQKLFESE